MSIVNFQLSTFAAFALCYSLFIIGPARAADNDIRFTFWGDYHLSAAGSIDIEDGIFQVAGDFDVAINDAARFDFTNATLQFIGFPNAGPFDIEAMSEDIGFCDLTLPDPNLFSFKRLWIGPTTIGMRFVDNHDNAPGAGAEAIYTETLRFESGTTLDVRGINLYYITLIPADAGDPGSGVTITDSVGGGGIFALGTDSPVTPINPGTSDNEICDGDSTTLFAEANSGLEIDWYTDDCGISPSNRPLGTFVGTGSPLIVSPLDTTVYWAQSRNPTTGCISRICSDSVTVIVHDNPLCTITSDAIVCTGASELTANVQDAGSDTTYDWSVTGGTITGGQNTPTITYIADDVGTILLEVTIDKTWSDGDGSTCQTYCQLTIYTDRYVWTGADGAYFNEPSNWDLGIVPGSVPPGGDAIITNTTSVDNTCIMDDPGGSLVMCNVKVKSTGSGRQILRIEPGSVLATTVATLIDAGGEVALRDGEIAGGAIYNNSGVAVPTVSGYGRITADLVNAGLVRTSPLRLLELYGNWDNQSAGALRAVAGSGVLVESSSVTQDGTIEVQTNATVAFAQPLTNAGSIVLYDGSIAPPFLTNDAGGLIYGFGTIQSSVDNDGDMISIADMQVIGNLQNEGTITIQSGLLTVTGTLSGSGTIIGGLGGRDGGSSGDGDSRSRLPGGTSPRSGDGGSGGAQLIIGGDLDLSTRTPADLNLADTTLQMTGSQTGVVQRLEVFSEDRGPTRRAMQNPNVIRIGTLRIGPPRIGPDETTVQPAGPDARTVDPSGHGATTVQLVDRRDNLSTAGHEALYVNRLVLEPGVTLDLAGQRLYYNEAAPANPQAPNSGVSIIDTLGGGSLRPITAGDKSDRFVPDRNGKTARP